jgi:hypothetical protein
MPKIIKLSVDSGINMISMYLVISGDYISGGEHYQVATLSTEK